jgi:hypothetical protein
MSDRFVIADLGGAWVRLDRIQALLASAAYGNETTRVVLSSGEHVHVKGTPQEVADRIVDLINRADDA